MIEMFTQYIFTFCTNIVLLYQFLDVSVTSKAKQSKENPNIFAPYVLRNIFDLVSSVDPVKTGLFQDFNDVSPFTFERQ